MPHDEFLARAADELVARGHAQGAVRWRVQQRLERPKSTVFVLDAEHPGGTERLYYKVDEVHAGGQLQPQLLRSRQRSLEVEAQLAERLEQAAAGRFRTDQVLVSDPEVVTAVRREVAGAPLGKAAGWMRPDRRSIARGVYRTVGHAIRVMEDVGRTIDEPITEEALAGRVGAMVARAADVLQAPALAQLREHLDALVPAVAPHGQSWSHGDVSQTNVLVDRDGTVGIIDASWAANLPCWDLVRFIARVECETPRWPAWTRQVVGEVMGGYGIDRDRPSAPWQLARSYRAMQGLGAAHPQVRRWGIDALLEELNRRS